MNERTNYATYMADLGYKSLRERWLSAFRNLKVTPIILAAHDTKVHPVPRRGADARIVGT
jgi:hypothetical protein